MVELLFAFIIAGNAVLGTAFFVYGLYCCWRDRNVSAEEIERAEMRSSSWPTPQEVGEEEEARR